jgi:hypothetical protein
MTTIAIALAEARRAKLHKDLDRVLKELIELDDVPWTSMLIDLVARGGPVRVTISVEKAGR